MLNILQINYNGKDVKYVLKDGANYICLKDVCDILELLNSNNVSKRIPDEYKELFDVTYEVARDNFGNPVYRNIPTVFIAEKGIEFFLNTSRKRELANNLLNWFKSVNLISSEDDNYAPLLENDILGLHDILNVRCYKDDNEVVWLNTEDVARGLGMVEIKNNVEYVRWRDIYRILEDFKNLGVYIDFAKSSERMHGTINRVPAYISENIFYRLASKLTTPRALQFQSKVFDEVLPMIRRTGMYMAEQVYNRLVSDPTQLGEMMLDYGRVKKELEDNRYKMDSYDRFMDSKQSFSMATVAKSLVYTNPNKNNSVIGRNEMFAILRDLNILQTGSDSWNMPYQEHVDQGYFQINIKEVNSNGTLFFIKQVKVLPKGIEFIINILNQNGYSINRNDIPDEIN